MTQCSVSSFKANHFICLTRPKIKEIEFSNAGKRREYSKQSIRHSLLTFSYREVLCISSDVYYANFCRANFCPFLDLSLNLHDAASLSGFNH